jgi:hypothetical protein
MNDLQIIRRAYEAPVETALTALVPPIPVYTDNRFYDADDAKSEFCLCRVSFGLMTENTIGVCGDIEFIRGSMVIEVFTPKGAGPGRGQEIAQALWQALMPLNTVMGGTVGVIARTGPFQGPAFTPLQGRPHFMTRLSVPIRPIWLGGPPPPPTLFRLVTDEGFGIITDQGDRIVAFLG